MTSAPSRPLDEGDAVVVARAAVLRGLSSEARADVAARARKLASRRGQTLFTQGERLSAVFLVLRGRVKVLAAGDDGHAVVLRVEGPGELLGLLDALPAQVFQGAGLGACVGCAMAPHETLGEAARALNLDLAAGVRQPSRALRKERG